MIGVTFTCTAPVTGAPFGIDQRVRWDRDERAVLAVQRAAGRCVGQCQRAFARQHPHVDRRAAGTRDQIDRLELVGVAGLAELQHLRRTGGDHQVGLAVGCRGSRACAALHADRHAGERRGGIGDDGLHRGRRARRCCGADADDARRARAAAAPVGHGQRHRVVAGRRVHMRKLRTAAARAVAEIPAVGQRIAVGIGRTRSVERERRRSSERSRRGERRHRRLVGGWWPASARSGRGEPRRCRRSRQVRSKTRTAVQPTGACVCDGRVEFIGPPRAVGACPESDEVEPPSSQAAGRARRARGTARRSAPVRAAYRTERSARRRVAEATRASRNKASAAGRSIRSAARRQPDQAGVSCPCPQGCARRRCGSVRGGLRVRRGQDTIKRHSSVAVCKVLRCAIGRKWVRCHVRAARNPPRAVRTMRGALRRSRASRCAR